MRSKLIFIFLVMILLASCAAPTATQTSEVLTATPTQTPASTPTSTVTPEPALPSYGEIDPSDFDWAALPVGVEHRLTDEDKAELGLAGNGFAETVDYEGVKVTYVMLLGPDVVEKMGGLDITLMQNPPEGVDPARRMAEIVLRGHHLGYQEDHGTISFDEFVQKLRDGEDMSYTVRGSEVGVNRLGLITVNPAAPVELVLQHSEHSKNGDTWIKNTIKFGYGYYRTAGGGLRVIVRTPFEFDPGDDVRSPLYTFLNHSLIGLWVLGLDEEAQASGYDVQRIPGDTDDYESYNKMVALMVTKSIKDKTWTFDDMILQPAR